MHDETHFLKQQRDLGSAHTLSLKLGRAANASGERARSPPRQSRHAKRSEWDSDLQPRQAPAGYRGAQPAWPLTNESVSEMIEHFRAAPGEPLYESMVFA
eukprot:SAG11_NODE_22147_length_411_cov_0.826923_1_plen_99_part_01